MFKVMRGSRSDEKASDVAPTDYRAKMQMCTLTERQRNGNVALMQLC